MSRTETDTARQTENAVRCRPLEFKIVVNNQFPMYISRRKAVKWVFAIIIFGVSSLNFLIFNHQSYSLPIAAIRTRPAALTVNITDTIDRTCDNLEGRIPARNLSDVPPRAGSRAESILPINLYPIIHNSCYFLPTSPRDQSRHLHLLQYYPNSFLVITSEDEAESIRLDIHTRTIYIRGIDKYALLWIKTSVLWNYISVQSKSNVFKDCKWFFKVDTDSFLNLHVIEQYLQQYSCEEDHYIGWYAGGARIWKNQTLNIGTGPFYGFSRSIIQKWSSWQNNKQFSWGSVDDHKGEDSQVAMFLRTYGICLDVPVIEMSQFRRRSGVWDGFHRGHPLGASYFREGCRRMIHNLLDNSCFSYAHKVSTDWMPVLTDVMTVHVVNQTKCELFGKGVSRLVNGSVYHQVEKTDQCTVHDCDPCLNGGLANDCCRWKPRN